MKQTNNAIKFLLAQYRAIYKYAHIKGVLSSAILSLGLVAGATQAEDLGFSATKPADDAAKITVNITGNQTVNSGNNYAHDLVVGNNAIFNITTNNAGSAVFIKDKISLNSGSTLNITGTGIHIAQLLGTWDSLKGSTASLSANGATINLTDHGNLAVKTASFNGSKITLGSNSANFDKWGDYTNFWTRGGDSSFINSSIVMNHQSVIGTSSSKNITFDNTNLTMNGTIPVVAEAVKKTEPQPSVVFWGGNLTLKNKASVNVSAGKIGALAINNITMNDATTSININKGGVLNMHGTFIHGGTEPENEGWSTDAENSVFKLQAGKVNNDGTLHLGKINNQGEYFTGGENSDKGKTVFTIDGGELNNNAGAEVSITKGSQIFYESGSLNNKSTAQITIADGAELVLNGGTLNNLGTITATGKLRVNLDKYTSGFDVDTLGAKPNTGNVISGEGGIVFGNSADAQADTISEVSVDNLAQLHSLSKNISLDNANIRIDALSTNLDNDSFSGTSFNLGVEANKSGNVLMDTAIYTAGTSNKIAVSNAKSALGLVIDDLTFKKKDQVTDDLTLENGNFFVTSQLSTADKSKLVITEKGTDQVNLNLDAIRGGNTSGIVDVALEINSGDVNVLNGSWTGKDVTLSTANSSFKIGDAKETAASFLGDKLTLTAGSFVVEKGASASFKATLGNGATASVKGSFTVLGDGSKESVDFVGGSNFNIDGGTLDLSQVSDTIGFTINSGTISVGSGYSKVAIANGGTVIADLAGFDAKLSLEQANSILGHLATGNGLVSLKNVQIDLGVKDNKLDFNKLAANGNQAIITFNDEQTKKTTITGMSSSDKLSGGWKNVVASGSTSSIGATANQTLEFYGSSEKGSIVSNEQGQVVGVKLETGSVLNLKTSGQIGALDSDNGNINLEGNKVAVVNADSSASADVKAEAVGLTNQAQLSAKLVQAKSLNIDNALLDAETVKVKEAGNVALKSAQITAKSIDFGKATNAVLEGGSVQGTDVTVAKDTVLKGGTQLNTTNLKLAEAGRLAVGVEGQDSSSANVVTTNLDLNNGRLVIDPEFNQNTASVFAKVIGKETSGSMLINGDIVVGRNSALGIGGIKEEFTKNLASHQNNGSLSEDGYGSYVYIDRSNINLNGHSLIMGTEDIDVLEAKLKSRSTSSQIYLGEGSAMQFSATALNGSTTVFVGDNHIVSEDGTFIVPANASGEQLAKIFGEHATLEQGDMIYVTTANRLYEGWIRNTDDLKNGITDFKLASNAVDLLDVSDPTFDYIIELFSDKSKRHNTYEDFDNAPEDQKYGENGVGFVEKSLGYAFIQDSASYDNGRSIERAARLAHFAGAVQATHNASRSTNEAILSRFGVGTNTSSLTVANNNQGAALWVSPIYKNQEHKNLKAQGIDYGADLDFFGASLGFDYGLANSMRFGAMFNVGSGDSKGLGAGEGIKDDFDYFGFGVYAGFSPINNLTLSADLSYTVVDNDLSLGQTITNHGKLSASSDSTALSIGANMQYRFITNAVDLVPHIGMRFTRLDIDNYIVKSALGEFAETSSDAMNVFSIPLGVTIAKDIVSGSWTIRPAVDFTVTANFGDDSMKSTTIFDGVEGLEAKYDTEVLSNFTYGADFGISGSNGSFSFGLNAGYVGGSDLSEFGVGANARFAF